MTQKFLFRVLTLAALVFCLEALPQEGQNHEKALRYHEMLRKRPGAALLFDRFHDAWLDTGTPEDLGKFLGERAEKEDSTAADLLILGYFHVRRGNDQRALESFARALEKEPGNGMAWHEKAKISARALNFEEAIADLDQGLATSPPREQALEMAQLRGRLLVRSGRTEEALAAWKKILAENPQDLDFHEDLVELQVSEGLYEEALAESRDLTERTADPYLKLLRRLRSGDICQKAGKRKEALAIYQDCLSQTGGGSWIEKEILSQIERVFRREDDLSGLAEFLANLKEAGGPSRPALARLRAEAHLELGQPEAAIALFTELLARLPGDLALRSSFVELLRRAGQPARAVSEMETLVKQHPDDPEWLVTLAGLQHAAGQTEASLASLAAFLEKSGEKEAAFLRVARLQESFAAIEAAEISYETVMRKFPESLGAKESFAAFLHRIGKRDEAVSIWSILGGSGDRDQALRMARALISRQEYEAARQILAKHYDAWKNDPAFLAQFCDTGIRLKQFDSSVDAALRWVQLAGPLADFENAVKNSAIIIAGSGRGPAIRQELGSRLDRLSPPERCLLAELLEKEGDFENTDRVLAGDSALVLSQRARILRLRNDWRGAAEAMSALLEVAPEGKKSPSLRDLIGLYRRAGLPAEAKKRIPQWKAVSPGGTEPWLVEAALELEAGNEPGSIVILKAASRKFPDDVTIRAELATVYERTGHNEDARRIYLELFESCSELADKIRWAGRLAHLSQSEGKIDQLIENFQERRRANRQSIVPLLALAEIHRISGEYEERRQALLEASRLKPDDVPLLLEIARIEEAEGDWEAALKTLGRARAMEDSARIVERTAALLLRGGETDEGFRLLGELGNKASGADAFLHLAEAVAALRDWGKLDEFLSGGADLYPGDYRIDYLRGVAREESGNFAAAAECFFTVLGAKEEIPRHPGTNATPGGGLDEQTQSFPPGYETYIQFLSAGPQAYEYRHAQNQPGYFGAPLSGAGITLPGSLKEFQAAALAHLAQIREASDASARELLDHAVKAAAGTDAVILCQLPFDSSRVQAFIPEEVLDAHPGNLALHAAWLASNRRNLPELRHFERCYRLFEKDYPVQAFQAAIAAVRADSENGRPLLDQALSLLDHLRVPGHAEWQVLTALHEAQQSRAVELTEPQKERLLAKLFELYPRAAGANSPARDWIFQQIAAVLAKGDDARAFVRLLEDKIAEPNPSPSYGTSQEQLVVPLAFPPDDLEKIPPSVLAMAYRSHYQGSHAELSQEKCEAFFQAATHPVLKIFFALEARHDQEKIDALVHALSSAPGVDPLDAAQIQAAWHALAGRFSEVLAVLEKKRFLPMSRELRKRFDAAMIHAAVQLGKGAGASPDLEGAGKAAALRLACHPLNASQREELISAMASLGMDAAVEKEEQKAALASSAPALPNPASHRDDKIEKFLALGKQDAAIREAVSQVRTLARSVLSGSDQNWRYYGSNTLRVLEKHNLTGAILEAFARESSKSAAALRDYAAAALILNDEKLALEILRRGLRDFPRAVGTRFLLAALAVKQGETLPSDLVASLSTQEIALAADWIYQDLSSGASLSLEEELQVFRSLLPLIHRSGEPSGANGDWPYNLMRHLARDRTIPGANLGALYQNPAATADPKPPAAGSLRSPSRDQKKADANAKRWELHDQYVAALKKNPHFAELAFECEYAGAVARQLEFDALGEARRVVLAISSLPTRVQGFQQSLHSFDYPGAAELLVADAFRQKRRELIDPQLTGEMKSRKNGPETVRLLNNIAELYFCEPSSLHTVFSRRFPDNQYGIQLQRNAEPLFIRAIEAKQLPADAIESLGLAAARRNLASGSPYPSQLLNQLIAKKLFEAAPGRYAAYLGKLLDLYCGDAETRRRSGADDERLRNFGFLLGELAEKKNLTFPTLDFMAREGFQADYLPEFLRQSSHYRSAAAFMSLFSPSSLLASSVADFDPYEVTHSGAYEPASVFELAAHRTRSDAGQSVRSEIVAALQKLPGFGPSLLASAIEEDTAALHAIGSRHFDEILRLPPDRQAALARVIQKALGGSLFEEPSLPFNQWVVSSASDQLDGEIQQFLKARTLRDLHETSSGPELHEAAIRLMTAKEMTDPNATLQIFRQAVKIARLTMKTDPNAYFEPEFAETLLSEYADDLNHNPNRARVLFEILTAKDPALAVRYPGFGDYLGISFRLPLDPDTLTQCFRSLEDQIGDNKAAQLLLAMEFPTADLGENKNNLVVALRWLQETLSAEPRSLLAETVAMTVRLEALKSEAAHRPFFSALEPLESCRPFFEDFLFDQSLPQGLRLALAAHLLENYPGQWSPAAILQVSRESIASLNDDETYCLPAIFEKIITAFGSLPQTEEWTATAQALLPAWKKRTRYSAHYIHPLRYETGNDLLAAVSHVLIRLGDESALNSFQNRWGEQIANIGQLVSLVANGRDDRAVALLNTHRNGLENACHANAVFSAQLAQRMEEFLAKIDEPGLRFYAEAALSQAPDPPGGPAGEISRKQRLIALAQRFESAGLNGSLRDAALNWMLEYPETAPFLSQTLAQYFEAADLERISHPHDYSVIRQTLRIPFFHVRTQLDAGNAAPAIRAWDAFSGRGSSGYGPSMLRDLCAQIDFAAPLKQKQHAAAAARLEFLHHALSVSSPEILLKHPVLASRFLILAAFSKPHGAPGDLQADRIEVAASLLRKSDLLVTFLNLLSRDSSFSEAEKASALRELNRHPLFHAAFPAHPNFFQSIHLAAPLPFALLEPLFEEMSAAFPRQGWAQIDLALVLAREKQWEKAWQRLEKCKLSADDSLQLKQRFQIAAAEILHGMGRSEEARERIKNLESLPLSKENRSHLERVKATIDPAATDKK